MSNRKHLTPEQRYARAEARTQTLWRYVAIVCWVGTALIMLSLANVLATYGII